MHQDVMWPMNKEELYPLLEKQLESLVEGCPPVSALANAAALLWEAMADINWVGFYLRKDGFLYLGPFQGKTACTLIPVGRGVCGTAAKSADIQLVKDVHQFPGHIACDSASNSEIVLPLIKNGVMYGLLDIDSPLFARFDQADAAGLKDLCQMLMKTVDWSNGLL